MYTLNLLGLFYDKWKSINKSPFCFHLLYQNNFISATNTHNLGRTSIEKGFLTKRKLSLHIFFFLFQFIKTSPEPGEKLQMGYMSIMRTGQWVSQWVGRTRVDYKLTFPFHYKLPFPFHLKLKNYIYWARGWNPRDIRFDH